MIRTIDDTINAEMTERPRSLVTVSYVPNLSGLSLLASISAGLSTYVEEGDIETINDDSIPYCTIYKTT